MANSRQYEWNDITVRIGGRDIVGIRGIEFKKKQELEHFFGKGNKPQSIQGGNIMPEGNIGLSQSEYETLCAANNSSVLGMTVNILWTFGNPSTGDVPITREIQGVRFSEEGIAMKQGDKFGEISLPFLALDIVVV